VAQEERQVSGAQQLPERQADREFRASRPLPQQRASPLAARLVVSLQLAQPAEQEQLARQAWKE
jgi:hypothetical protein